MLFFTDVIFAQVQNSLFYLNCRKVSYEITITPKHKVAKNSENKKRLKNNQQKLDFIFKHLFNDIPLKVGTRYVEKYVSLFTSCAIIF